MTDGLRIRVNGEDTRVACDPMSTLHDVLHDRLGLLSVRAPCRAGVCGACSVLVDGQLFASCLLPAAAVEGRDLLTSEGIGDDHPVRAAFERAGAFQCGYCIPGFVLAVVAWCNEGALDPDDATDRLAGNLCRCGSYVAIRRALRELSQGAVTPQSG